MAHKPALLRRAPPLRFSLRLGTTAAGTRTAPATIDAGRRRTPSHQDRREDRAKTASARGAQAGIASPASAAERSAWYDERTIGPDATWVKPNEVPNTSSALYSSGVQ